MEHERGLKGKYETQSSVSLYFLSALSTTF